MLRFDSSWRQEDTRSASVLVSFDVGEPMEVLVFDLDSGSGNFKNHAPNDTVVAPLQNPEGAEAVVLTFGYLDAGNNWWWAIDNIRLTSAVLPSAAPLIVLPLIPGQEPPQINAFSVNEDGSITIEYRATLQGSETVGGPYQPVNGASSPFTVNPGAGPAIRFYIAR